MVASLLIARRKHFQGSIVREFDPSGRTNKVPSEFLSPSFIDPQYFTVRLTAQLANTRSNSSELIKKSSCSFLTLHLIA